MTASVTQAASMGPASSRGSVTVRRAGGGFSVTKVSNSEKRENNLTVKPKFLERKYITNNLTERVSGWERRHVFFAVVRPYVPL